MIPIELKFANYEVFDTDVFVVDYTNATDSVRKLEFHTSRPNDIGSFHLVNRQKINVYGVNFEKNPAYTKGHKMCECMFTPITDKKSPWVLLLEMKYCQNEDNIDEDSADALVQLKDSYLYLNEIGLLDSKEHHIHLLVSIPDYSYKEPFTNFRETQSNILSDFKENSIQIHGVNRMLIATPNYLFEKKRNRYD